MGVVLDGEKDKENVGSEIKPCFIIVDTSLEAMRNKSKQKEGFSYIEYQQTNTGFCLDSKRKELA